MASLEGTGHPGSYTPDSAPGTSETRATSISLGPLQTKGPAQETFEFIPIEEDEPGSYELIAPPRERQEEYSLEHRSNQMFSRQHLEEIFANSSLLLRFSAFLSKHRSKSVPMLIFYLDALKALRAIKYANAVSSSLDHVEGYEFTKENSPNVTSIELEKKVSAAFDVLVENDLAAFITHQYVHIVSIYISRRITGTLASHLRETSEGLAEVFCLTDPSRNDNPIIFASEEFNRTTQYGMNYCIGRNCRFLQGPHTNSHSTKRIKQAIEQGREHSEVLLNYRRDGSPFMNLLMIAPLMDGRGKLRYFIGAQVDVSGLVRDCTDLGGLQALVNEERHCNNGQTPVGKHKDKFQALSEMLNMSELDTVRLHGGDMHRDRAPELDDQHSRVDLHSRPRLMLKDPSNEGISDKLPSMSNNGRLSGIYSHYLLIRPYPSLRVLFASPTLRIPGMLQSHFMDRIGGSSLVRDDLVAALAEGRGVTAKVRWTTRFSEEGRPRFVHCTPLIGANHCVGVWMVVLVDADVSPGSIRLAESISVEESTKQTDNREVRQQQSGSSRDLIVSSAESRSSVSVNIL